MQKILYESNKIQREIIRRFSTSRKRRVAIVGEDAQAYLPHPNGIELVCWPQAGGTNPDALRRLIKLGVEVLFVDGLHMKLYWTQDRGAIVTSANLSTNALGAGNLKEIGVLLDSGKIQIDAIISQIKPRKCTAAELKRLDRAHKLYASNNRSGRGSRGVARFGQWFVAPGRSNWKLGWWDWEGHISINAKAFTKAQYGIPSPNDFLGCRTKDYRRDDWVLCFKLATKRATDLRWLYVNHLVPVSRNDKKAYEASYPFQAIQMWSQRVYAGMPFRIDSRFRRAFAKAVTDFGSDKIRNLKSQSPPPSLMNKIYSYYNHS